MGMKDLKDTEKDAAKDFWLWLVRVAQPEVVHANDAIECHGFKDGCGLVPVLTIDELTEMWYDKTLIMSKEESDKYQKG
jgi:hypothetical protein